MLRRPEHSPRSVHRIIYILAAAACQELGPGARSFAFWKLEERRPNRCLLVLTFFSFWDLLSFLAPVFFGSDREFPEAGLWAVAWCLFELERQIKLRRNKVITFTHFISYHSTVWTHTLRLCSVRRWCEKVSLLFHGAAKTEGRGQLASSRGAKEGCEFASCRAAEILRCFLNVLFI